MPIKFRLGLSCVGRIEKDQAPETLITLQIAFVEFNRHAGIRDPNHPPTYLNRLLSLTSLEHEFHLAWSADGQSFSSVHKQAFHADIVRLVRRKADIVVPDFDKQLNR
jgi:hypothetical protein